MSEKSEETVDTTSKPLFELGTITVDNEAISLLSAARLSKYNLLERHQKGDFGDLTPEQAKIMMQAAKSNSGVRSIYAIGDRKVHVVTDERRATTRIIAEPPAKK